MKPTHAITNLKFLQPYYNADGTLPNQQVNKRVKHACLMCQSRKVKCSGTFPCTLCLSKKFECVFRDNTRPSPSPQRLELIHHKSSRGHRQRNSHGESDMPGNSSLATESSTAIERCAKTVDVDISKTLPIADRRSKTTSQPFFRWLGPTAIAPPEHGTFRLLSINLRCGNPDENKKPSLVLVEKHGNFASDNSMSNSSEGARLPKSDGEFLSTQHPLLPDKKIYNLFRLHMSNYLPYLSWNEFQDRLVRGVVGECLLFAMASLCERIKLIDCRRKNGFADDDNLSPLALADKYAEAAKRLVLPHLASPNVEVVYTLLLIAYCEFAADRDSGLWAWCGMAIRMCYDLGLHKVQNKHSSDSFHQNVFWSVVCLDRLISCGTGRSTTIPDTDIEYELEFGLIKEDGITRTDPFPYLCRLLILLGQFSNYINDSTRTKESAVLSADKKRNLPTSVDAQEQLFYFQQAVSDFYSTLPGDLIFDVQNLQDYNRINRSQVFLLLHIWNQALIMAVHHPTLVYPKFTLDVAGLLSSSRAELTGTGAISIADMISFADLINSKSFESNPFISQPIYMAARSALTLWHTLPPNSPSHSVYALQRTYNSCRKGLDRIEWVWRGTSWLSRTLDSLAASEPDVDLSTSKGFIETMDVGLARTAAVDETTRNWLVDEIGGMNSSDIYGLFIAGTVGDETISTGSLLQSDDVSSSAIIDPSRPRPSRRLSSLSANTREAKDMVDETNVDSSNVGEPPHYRLPVRRDFEQQDFHEQDSFKRLIMRSIHISNSL